MEPWFSSPPIFGHWTCRKLAGSYSKFSIIQALCDLGCLSSFHLLTDPTSDLRHTNCRQSNV